MAYLDEKLEVEGSLHQWPFFIGLFPILFLNFGLTKKVRKAKKAENKILRLFDLLHLIFLKTKLPEITNATLEMIAPNCTKQT